MMAILDYTNQLGAARQGALGGILQKAGQMQGLRNNEQLMQNRQQGIAEQQQKEQQQAALNREAQEVYSRNDINEIAEFSIANPMHGKNILAAKGIVNAEGKQRTSDKFADILTATDSKSQLIKTIKQGRENGRDMSDSEAILAQNLSDEGIKKAAGMALASIDGERFKSIQSAYSGGEVPMSAYQKELVKGGNADREIRKLEAQNKTIENTLKKETNQVKLDQLKGKVKENKDRQAQIIKNKDEAAQSVVASGESTLDIISEIEKHPGFESAIGAKGISSMFGAFDDPISGTDAAGVVALIETLEAQNFLTAIGQFKSAGGAGSLSDNEGKKLGAALSNLKTSQNEKDFKKSLNVIRELVKKQISRAKAQNSNLFSLDKRRGPIETQMNDDIDFSKMSLDELKTMRGNL